MINAIDLNYEKNDCYFNEFGSNLLILQNIKNINIFIGENNSGKSRFLRSLVKSDRLIYLTDSNVPKDGYLGVKQRIKQYIGDIHAVDSDISLNVNHDDLSPCNLYAYYYEQLKALEEKYKGYFPNNTLKYRVTNELSAFYNSLLLYDDNKTSVKKSIRKIYIPVLRGIECYKEFFNNDGNLNITLNSISMDNRQREAFDIYKENAEKIYINKISYVYGIDKKDIFTGENLFNEIRDKLLGSEKERIFIKEFEAFISKCFFDNEEFSIIPLINKGYLNVKIGSSEERALHNLGDGIKQIICILYKVFENKNKEAMICIEEPEINLHPGYQRKLIEILQSKEFSKIYFFITTHSNHIIDSCFDYNNISIYKFLNISKDNNKFKVINSSPNDIDILNQLGVNNSSVFMANCTIWVEGISDKIYLNKYLKTYIESKGLKDFKEGIDYSFVEYGGNNIMHWDFEDELADDKILASGITNRSFIVVDNDKGRKKKRKDALKKIFNNNFLELSVNEIENTIGNKLLEKYLKKYNTDFIGENPITTDSVEKKDVEFWAYIDSHYKLKKKYYNSKSNQPRIPKVVFAKQVCNLIVDVSDLSKSAIIIAKELYGFISSVSEEIN